MIWPILNGKIDLIYLLFYLQNTKICIEIEINS